MARVITAAPVYPNAGLRAEYEQRLTAMLDRLGKELVPIFTGAWGDLYELQYPPQVANDASFAVMMADYERRMAEALEAIELEATGMAEWFGMSAATHASTALAHNVSAAIGGRVSLQMSAEVARKTQGIINENITLIRSVASEHAERLTQAVTDSVMAGRDLAGLTRTLTDVMGMDKRRAAFIALDQNNKATSAIDHERKREMGIVESVWKHVPVAKVPRPLHLLADGKTYNNDQGMLIGGEYTFPGVEINCHCVSRAVIPGAGSWAGLGGEWSLSTGETSKGLTV